jgi:DNA-binding CsgD family transcriptional regulator
VPYGEWLCLEGRDVDARSQLRIAFAQLTQIGADAFAERATRDLLATGETVRRPAAGVRAALTPRETLIARLAADGHTNPDIGAQLFISPRTVEYHLRKVFGSSTSARVASSRKRCRSGPPRTEPRSGR